MRKLLIFIVGFSLFFQAAYCQFMVSGIVYDNDDLSPFPGAYIVEKGTQNGTISSIDGEFSISVKDENAVLVFSGVGYIIHEVKIKGQENLVVNLKSDCTKDFFDGGTIIYWSSGVVNTPLGGELRLGHYVSGVLVVPSFGYQTNLDDNNLMNASLSLNHLVVTCDFDIDVKLYVRSLRYHNEFDAGTYSIEINANQFYDIFDNPSGIIIGYGRMSINHGDPISTYVESGVIAGITTGIGMPLYIDVVGKVGIFKDVIEYQFELSRYLRPVQLFVRYYKLSTFNELSIGVGKELYFKKRTRAKLPC